MAWPDLAALSLLSPDIGEVGGALAMSIDVAGSVADPILGGRAAIADGRVAIPEWGILIDRIEGEAMSPDGTSLEYRGTGYIEDSEIRVTGASEFDPSAGWPTRLKIVGDNVTIASRSDARILASPDLDVTIRLPRIDVSGRVLVPEADISVEQLPLQAVKVSPDSIVHGSIASEPVRPLEVAADVTVELGDFVNYTGSNLNTNLSGALRLEYQSGLSPAASGSVTLAGSYDAYGQTLDLERGELLFAGPLNNPAIDVLAVRRIGSTVAGIRLSGTLLAPVPSLYSEPQMSEANALSYLMFGRPLSSSDNSETATLQSTALALGLQQALPVVQRLGETLGLDELSIEPTEVDAGALMAGKHLSPKVYMSYSYGLFNRLGGFLLRYQFNDRLSLETRSGDEKSMDLLYSIEKN
jgi:translocation and assembly module TamB